MRLAVAGKGGAGKTTISATLARLVAEGDRQVVAVDADANPNLGVALGMRPSPLGAMPSVPASLVSRRQGGAGLTAPVATVLDAHSTIGPAGIRLVHMGAPTHADEGCLCSAHATVSALLEDLGDPAIFVVVDMEASPEHLSRGTIRHVDALLLVAEPYYRSLETVRRMSALVAELPVARVAVVANKIRGEQDAAAVAEFCERHQLELAGSVCWSDKVVVADREGVPVFEWPPASNVVAAIRQLSTAMLV